MRSFLHLNPRTWKIHTKIFAALTLTIFLAILILSINSFLSLRTNVKTQNGNSNIVLGSEIYQHYSDLIQTNIDNILTLSQMDETVQTIFSNGKVDQAQKAFFQQILDNYQQFNALLLLDKNGSVLYQKGESTSVAVEKNQLPSNSQAFSFSDLQLMEDDQIWQATITVPVYDESVQKSIGYLQVNLDMSQIFTALGEISINGNGSIVLCDESGSIIYHADHTQIGKSIPQNIADSFEQESARWFTTEMPSTQSQTLITLIPPQSINHNALDWYFIMQQDLDNLYKPIQAALFRSWGIAILSLAVLGIIAFFTSKNMFKTISIINASAEYLSRGDLSLREINRDDVKSMLKSEDELGAIGRAFSSMIDYFRDMSMAAAEIAMGNLAQSIEPKSEEDSLGNAFILMVAALKETITDMNMQADSLKLAATSLSQNAEDSCANIKHMAMIMDQVADGTDQQSNSIQQTLDSVSELSQAIDGVAKGAHEQAAAVQNTVEITSIINQIMQEVGEFARTVSESSQVAAGSADKGSQVMQETIQGMMRIKNTVDQSVIKVTEMGNRSQQVESILETINDIASQTNLLALNAAIEAARAGEHGKGFAVVAEEVRKLAERSSAATSEIAQIISGIQESVEDAVAVMEDGVNEVESGVQLANHAGDSLSSIHQDINTLNTQAQQVEIAMRSMSNSVNDLVKSSETVSAVVEENTAATEEMAASSTEVTTSVQEISTISDENKELIEMVANSTSSLFEQADQVSTAAQELMVLADHLTGIVEQYQLSEE